jgi:hypothetical protein
MAHQLTPPRSDLTYAVVDIDGAVISWHRSRDGAQHAIDAEWHRFRRRYPADGSRGNAIAYLPRSIVHCATDGQYIERTSHHSTNWA